MSQSQSNNQLAVNEAVAVHKSERWQTIFEQRNGLLRAIPGER